MKLVGETTPVTAARRGPVVEALVAGAIVMTVALVLSPSAPGGGATQPHLLWIAVLVLATQYGVRGLLASLVSSLAALGLASICVGESLSWIATFLTSPSELVVLTGAIAVAWVAGGHARRKAQLAEATQSSAARADEAHSSFSQLRGVADGLVRQLDRAQLSISYLRSLAERIDGADPLVGADAAIELALSRLDARVGAVLLHDGARLRLYAHRGVWSADSAVPPQVFQDRTAEQAFRLSRPVSALHIGTPNEIDSDLAAPIPGKDGKPCGVLVVRGIKLDLELASIDQHAHALADMNAVARWISRSAAEVVLPRPSSSRIATGAVPFQLTVKRGDTDAA